MHCGNAQYVTVHRSVMYSCRHAWFVGVESRSRPAPRRSSYLFALGVCCNDGLLVLRQRQTHGLPQTLPGFGALLICVVLQVALLRELFPFADPLRFVEGAPMLLALSEGTLRLKSDAWRHILESRVDIPWEKVRLQRSL